MCNYNHLHADLKTGHMLYSRRANFMYQIPMLISQIRGDGGNQKGESRFDNLGPVVQRPITVIVLILGYMIVKFSL